MSTHLEREHDDSDQTDPAVDGVEVGVTLIIVSTEHGSQSEYGKPESWELHEHVEHLNELFIFIPEHPVDQHGWKKAHQQLEYKYVYYYYLNISIINIYYINR